MNSFEELYNWAYGIDDGCDELRVFDIQKAIAFLKNQLHKLDESYPKPQDYK